jgi:hypothetical protein
METRRTRRIKQRRRVMAIGASLGVLGLGIGLALPRSETASLLLLAIAAAILATAGFRAAASTRDRDLKRRTRTANASATSAVRDWFWSRIVATPPGSSAPGTGSTPATEWPPSGTVRLLPFAEYPDVEVTDAHPTEADDVATREEAVRGAAP